HRPRQPAAVSPPRYPHAIVARYDLSGVISVVGTATQAWAVREIPRAGAVEQPAADTRYQLVSMNMRTNTVRYRIALGRQPRDIAAGAGRVWLTTPFGEAGG